jgi:hypothetical protein
LLDQDIELAFVFGDPSEMLDHSMECLRRRIPISEEKPAAPSLPQLDELVSEADRAGVKAFAPLVLRTSKVPEVINHLGVVTDKHALYLTGPASRYTTGGPAGPSRTPSWASAVSGTSGRTSWTCSHSPLAHPSTPLSVFE